MDYITEFIELTIHVPQKPQQRPDVQRKHANSVDLVHRVRSPWVHCCKREIQSRDGRNKKIFALPIAAILTSVRIPLTAAGTPLLLVVGCIENGQRVLYVAGQGVRFGVHEFVDHARNEVTGVGNDKGIGHDGGVGNDA